MPSDRDAARLVLGTVQLGLDYGVSGRSPRPDFGEALAILRAAHAGGVRAIDTAQSYGDSEAVIGRALATDPALGFRIVTKLDPAIDATDAGAVRAAIAASRGRLGHAPAALLLHSRAHLDAWARGLGDALGAAVAAGDVGALGVSVYAPDEFAAALAVPDLALIQAPFNVFDRRLLDSGLAARAADAGRQVHLRSVLLQGLLTMTADDLPPAMAFASRSLAAWRAACERHGLAPAAAALRFALDSVPWASVVVGCNTARQLAAILEASRMPPLAPAARDAFQRLPPGGERLIDPRTWPV